jgi:hypothetical protein
MEQYSQFVQQNSSIIGTVAFLVLIIVILYVVYTYLYPAEDPTYTQFLIGEADARKPIPYDKRQVPAIYTGGDFTLSFWIYIDDWNYKANTYKHLFSISPEIYNQSSYSPVVGLLTPLKNNLMVTGATVGGRSTPSPGSSSSPGSAGPDITVESNLQNLLQQKISMNMFEDTVKGSPCDVKEVPLQRWVCITIVSTGRVMDVYMDGKLSRSCMLDNVLQVPRGKLVIRLGDNGGFGGRYSSVQMWGTQLTPDVIYGIYQMGPTQTKHSIFTDIAKYLNLNVSFTGSSPGQPVSSQANINPFTQIYNQVGGELNSMTSSYQNGGVSGMMRQAAGDVSSNAQALMARF